MSARLSLVANTHFFPVRLEQFDRREVDGGKHLLKTLIALDVLGSIAPLKERARMLVLTVEIHRVGAADLLHKGLDAGAGLGPQNEIETVGHEAVAEDIDQRLVAVLVTEYLLEALPLETHGRILGEDVAHHDVVAGVVEIEQEKKTLVVSNALPYCLPVGAPVGYVIPLPPGRHLTPQMHELNYMLPTRRAKHPHPTYPQNLQSSDLCIKPGEPRTVKNGVRYLFVDVQDFE